MRFIVWIILVLGSIIAGTFLMVGGSFGMFINLISILVVFVPTWGALLIGFKGYLIKSITSIWETDVDRQTLGQCEEVWRDSIKYAIVFSFIEVLLGSVGMIANLNDPSTIGPSLSVILYGPLWGAVVG